MARQRVLAVVDGSSIELGHYAGDELAEAKRKAQAIEAAGPECAAVFAEGWMDLFPRRHDSSSRQMRYMIRRFVKDFGERPLSGVRPSEARVWARSHPDAARYARTMYEDAITEGLVGANPFAGVRVPTRGRRDLVIPTAEQLARIIALAPAPFDCLYGLAAFTGLRLGEIVAIRGEDIEGDVIQVRRQIDAQGEERLPKGGHKRQVAIFKEANGYIPHYKDVRLFPVPRSAVSYEWREVRRSIERDDLPFHGLRHYHATWLLDLGASPQDVAIQLGHRDGGRLVQELYGHPDHAVARDRLRRLVDGDSAH